MPRKATRLHFKGTPNSVEKYCQPNKVEMDNGISEDSIRDFQLQLMWCIQQLERILIEKKGSEQIIQESWKVLTVLKNNNQPIIRKRQMMRSYFGDYRAKMEAEEKKLNKMASKIKILDSPVQPKATFLRKSAFLTTGDSSFKFHFNIPKEIMDNDKIINQNKNSDLIIVNNVSGNISPTNARDNTDENKDSKFKNNQSKKLELAASVSEFKFNFKVIDA